MRPNQAAEKGSPCSRPRRRCRATAEREVSVSRVFDVPRERVYAAWTRPELLMGWWGLSGFTMTFCRVDLRPGGVFLIGMRSPGGRDVWSGGVYHEVVAAERLVFTAYFADGDARPRSSDLPQETLVTVTFADHGHGTRLTIREAIGPPLRMGVGFTIQS